MIRLVAILAAPARPATADSAGVLRRRAAAAAIDVLILSALGIVLGNVYGVTTRVPAPGSGIGMFSTSTALDWPWAAAGWFAYFAVLEWWLGATAGKLLLGLRVVDLDGRRPRWRAIAIRTLLRAVDWLPVLYLVGGAMVMNTRRQQRVGDRWASTLVVSRPDAVPIERPAQKARVIAVLLAGATVFSLGFDYFGRPPLVIRGLHNTGQLGTTHSYDLGVPTFGAGTVQYPIRFAGASPSGCAGVIRLRWQGLLTGWTLDSARTYCASGAPDWSGRSSPP